MRLITKGTQVAVEGGQQVFEQVPEGRFLLPRKKTAFVGTTEKVSRFVERTACNPDESLVISGRSPAVTFSNVGADAVGRTHDLLAKGGLGERVPMGNRIPYKICEIFGHGIDLQAIEGEFGHDDESRQPESHVPPNY